MGGVAVAALTSGNRDRPARGSAVTASKYSKSLVFHCSRPRAVVHRGPAYPRPARTVGPSAHPGPRRKSPAAWPPPTPSNGSSRALDPEQRRVAEALRGSGPGAGRRGDRQDPGDHPPHRATASPVRRPTRRPEVLAVTFTTRAAGEIRQRRRRLDGRPRGPGADLPHRRAAPAAATSGRTSTAPAELPDLTESKIPRMLAAACRTLGGCARRPGPGCATSPRRSSWAEGHQRPPRRPTPPSAEARGRGRSAASAPATVCRAHLRGLRGRQARPRRRMDMEDVLSPDRRASSTRDERVAAQVAPAVQVVRRRRVPGRLAPAVGPARPLAGRARASSASSATRPRPSTPFAGRRRRRTSGTSRSATRRTQPGSSWSATTAPPPQVVEGRPTSSSPGRRAPGSSCSAQQPTRGSAVRTTSGSPTRSPRPAGRRRPQSLRLRRLPGRPAHEMAGPVPDRTPSRESRTRTRSPTRRHPLRRARRGALLRASRGA